MRNTLMHHGVRDQKWGVRRYQNEDGSRTSLGRQHENELKRNRPTVKEKTKGNMTYFEIRANSGTSSQSMSTEQERSSRSSTVKEKTKGNMTYFEVTYNKNKSGATNRGSSTATKILKSSKSTQPLYSSSNEKSISSGKNAAKFILRNS